MATAVHATASTPVAPPTAVAAAATTAAGARTRNVVSDTGWGTSEAANPAAQAQLQPAGTQNGTAGFYYVASWPPVAPSNLEAERDTLAGQGVLDGLAENCREEMPFSLIYHRPTGGAEIVTAVTPLSTAAGCWAVVASFSEDAFPGAHLGQPYWATPPVFIAAMIYVTMAAITLATLLSVRGGLRRFALRARRIREQGPDAGSFADRDNLPELADVAAEFDRMVGR